jgi:chemotaxis protein methyltransferase WspC
VLVRYTRAEDDARVLGVMAEDVTDVLDVAPGQWREPGLGMPETWFFREPSAFDLLKRVAAERVAAGRTCRVLSLPCATGEEPYSMAMAFDEAGLAAGAVSIDAFDISRRALDGAARGVYGARAVRYVGGERLARYFTREREAYQLREEVRALVSFGRGNLVDEQVFAARGRYDVIFCRNVLIYFTAAARARVLSSLHSALVDDGWLVTGHAETSGVVAPSFVSARVPRTFAYRKALAGQATGPARAARSASAEPAAGLRLASPARVAVPPPTGSRLAESPLRRGALGGARARSQAGSPTTRTADRIGGTSASRHAPARTDLTAIERLADAGEFERAAGLCRDYLAVHSGSAQAYYLLGVIELARGQREAAEVALRAAIYLDPGHVAALRRLASDRRRQGDAVEAAQLLRRAEVVSSRQRRA